MKNAAAIAAQLVDMRNVGSAKSLRLTLHVPEEHALLAIEAFGWPTGAHPVPVAIARLTNVGSAQPTREAGNTGVNADLASRSFEDQESHGAHVHAYYVNRERESYKRIPVSASRPRKPLTLSQQAALACKDKLFWKYLETECDVPSCDENDATVYVRGFCNVNSRSMIIEGEGTGNSWLLLYNKFRLWVDHPELVEPA